MNTPDKCPGCGEGKCRDTVGKREYLCGSWRFHDRESIAESTTCLTNQLEMRDAIIKDLEAERNKAVARYEFIRRLTPRQFSELAKDNLSSGIPFDDMVDGRIKWAKP